MEKSENITELLKALIEAEKDFLPLKFNRMGQTGNHKFPYADLAALYSYTKIGLIKNGLKCMGVIKVHEDGSNVLSITLFHTSGQYITSTVKLSQNTGKASEMGANLTYMRRYLYAALLGIAADEDIDGSPLDEGPPIKVVVTEKTTTMGGKKNLLDLKEITTLAWDIKRSLGDKVKGTNSDINNYLITLRSHFHQPLEAVFENIMNSSDKFLAGYLKWLDQNETVDLR